jgi:hypothetical protein
VIREASVIVAESRLLNANVFYELGYAHATDKPTILLAERGHPLPFDIGVTAASSTTTASRGKKQVEQELRRHLGAIGSSAEM